MKVRNYFVANSSINFCIIIEAIEKNDKKSKFK